MHDTYDSAEDARLDRAQQRQLVRALCVSDLSLRRDECGAWRINGGRGHIYTWGDGETWCIYFGGSSGQAWSAAKKRPRTALQRLPSGTENAHDSTASRLRRRAPGRG